LVDIRESREKIPGKPGDIPCPGDIPVYAMSVRDTVLNYFTDIGGLPVTRHPAARDHSGEPEE